MRRSCNRQAHPFEPLCFIKSTLLCQIINSMFSPLHSFPQSEVHLLLETITSSE
uniref:Uncharacterized protein n=1 Tax=Tetranychus urticae TaxID=32264 RepID=T1K6N5_TETUR